MIFVLSLSRSSLSLFFFFNDTATTEIYTLSLHDALPICHHRRQLRLVRSAWDWRRGSSIAGRRHRLAIELPRDRKSTRLNSSHQIISYAVFCLKKKKKKKKVWNTLRTMLYNCYCLVCTET